MDTGSCISFWLLEVVLFFPSLLFKLFLEDWLSKLLIELSLPVLLMIFWETLWFFLLSELLSSDINDFKPTKKLSNLSVDSTWFGICLGWSVMKFSLEWPYFWGLLFNDTFEFTLLFDFKLLNEV